MRKAAAMYGIIPFETHWNVVIKRDGLTLQKTFSHSTCGGREASLSMAQTWRDEIVRAYPPVSRQEKAQTILSTNTSGIPGVSCSRWPDGSPRLWVARTVIGPGKSLSKAFSVSRFGDQAKLMAIEARQKQLLQLVGMTVPHPAEEAIRASPPRPHALTPPGPTARATVVKRSNPVVHPALLTRRALAISPGTGSPRRCRQKDRESPSAFP